MRHLAEERPSDMKTEHRKTTIAGIGMILTAVGTALVAIYDGQPETTVDFALLVPTVIGGIGLILAGDAKKAGE